MHKPSREMVFLPAPPVLLVRESQRMDKLIAAAQATAVTMTLLGRLCWGLICPCKRPPSSPAPLDFSGLSLGPRLCLSLSLGGWDCPLGREGEEETDLER